MRTLKSKALVLIGLALILAFPLLAQKSGAERCEKACGIPDLTAEQTTQIQKLKLEFEKAILALQADMKTKRLEFRGLIVEHADQKKLEAKIDEIAKVSADIQKKALAQNIVIWFSAPLAAAAFSPLLSPPTIVRKHRSGHQTMSRSALERRDVSVETVAGPKEPEIRQTSPPRTREDYEKYSPPASAAIRIS